MYQTLATIALAAAATALPAPQSGSAVGSTPEQSELFALAIEYDEGNFLSLNAVSNSTIGNFVVSAGRPSVYPGTPVYFNGTGDYKALNFYLEKDDPGYGSKGVYGIDLPQIGVNPGYAASAHAGYGNQQFEWSGDEYGVISHKKDAALNSFYACKDTASEGENIFLKWGNQDSNGQPPAGCQLTRVVQSFNVPGGKKSATS